MADEERFARLIERSGAFSFNDYRIFIQHYANYYSFIEVDNVAWRRNTLLVFEGSQGRLDTAKIKQLKERFKLFRYNKLRLVNDEGYPDFRHIRVFHYNLRFQRLI